MKALLSIFILFSLNAFAAVDKLDFKTIDQTFKVAGYPILENFMDTAIPGRCVHKFENTKTRPSVVLISVGEKGFEVAPITVKNQPADFFDELDWFDIFALFPEVSSQFLEVAQGDVTGLILKKKDLWGEDHAEIRESKRLFIIKAFKNQKFYRYCYYQKY